MSPSLTANSTLKSFLKYEFPGKLLSIAVARASLIIPRRVSDAGSRWHSPCMTLIAHYVTHNNFKAKTILF